VLNAARKIYERQIYMRDEMIELAETLKKAGCQDATILEHCYQREPHVRGCWVTDLLLDRA
jgi:hypothetical protein